MHERFFLEFHIGNEPAPVTDFGGGGLELNGEASAAPRGVAFRIFGADEPTRQAMDLVRRKKGWQGSTFKFNLRQEGARLCVFGDDNESLPPGRYKLDIRIGGFKLKRNLYEVRIPKDFQLRRSFITR